MTELHSCFHGVDGTLFAQTFDKARHLLETVLADFDEIDSQMVDADLLFKSLLEESEVILKFSSYLTPEEAEVIRQYWAHFKASRIEENDRRQLQLYQKLPGVYRAFKAKLESKGWTYRGAMFRQACSLLLSQGWQSEVGLRYVFVGFNKLTESQNRMMEWFCDQGLGLVITDDLVMDSHTAESRFFLDRQATRRTWVTRTENRINLTKATGNTTYHAYQGSGLTLGHQTLTEKVASAVKAGTSKAVLVSKDATHALALKDRLEIQGVTVRNLHRISVAASPLFSLLTSLFTLQQRLLTLKRAHAVPSGWLQDVLAHPITRTLYQSEVESLEHDLHEENRVLAGGRELAQIGLLGLLVSRHSHPATFWRTVLGEIRRRSKERNSDLEGSLKACLWALNALENQLSEEVLSDAWTFWTLFAGELSKSFLPIDAAQGQVTLATLADIQGQDFDSVVFLNANEGSLPAQLPRNSLIPLPFRTPFGLTTLQDDAAQQAYLFYRLVKRATQVHFYVNQASEDTQHAEPSRYLEQLRTFGGVRIEETSIQLLAQAHPALPIQVEKTPEVMERLRRYFVLKSGDRAPTQLYPTNLSYYLQCPFLFYLQVVAGIKEPAQLSEEMDGSRFGNVVHNAMEGLYQDAFEAKAILSERRLDAMTSLAQGMVRSELLKQYAFTEAEDMEEMGFLSVSEEVIQGTVIRLLQRDKERVPFVVQKLESRLDTPLLFLIQVGGVTEQVLLNGKFDRVDVRQLDGFLEVVDYKTSSRVETELKSWDEVFRYSDSKSTKEAFQIILYAWLLHKAEGHADVRPTVVRMNDLYDKDSTLESALFVVDNQAVISIADVSNEVEVRLRTLLEEIFDPNLPFKQTTNEKACAYCSFAGLCHRA